MTPRKRFLRTLGPAQTQEEAGIFDPPRAPDASMIAAWQVEAEKIERSKALEPWPETPDEGYERVVYVDGTSEWELEFDKRELGFLGEAGRARGINDATEGGSTGEASAPSLEPQGWSDGVDGRVRKPIDSTYPVNHRVLGRIGQLGGVCTGALVGRRLFLTAAHCVVPQSGAQVSYNIRIRRSSSTEPYGVVTTNVYWYSGNWIPNGCNATPGSFAGTCIQHDWALLLLPPNPWSGSPNGTPGWMGYWIFSQSHIASNPVNNNDGYPGCSDAGAPSGCSPSHTVWGQVGGGYATGFLNLHDGIPARYRTDRDVSPGHSGGPNWTDYPGTNGPYVIGIASSEACAGAACANQTGDTKTHPNYYRGMTPFLADFITQQRVAYP